jgi:hypothetical protein
MNDLARMIFNSIGRKDIVDKELAGLCTICGSKIDLEEFTDPLSLKEYYISGMCFKCQDEFFNHPYPEEPPEYDLD